MNNPHSNLHNNQHNNPNNNPQKTDLTNEINEIKNTVHNEVRETCQRYFNKQKEQILSNLRIYAKYDSEINYFLDKILAELQEDFSVIKKRYINELNDEFNEFDNKIENKTASSVKTIDDHLNTKVNQIIKREPYDVISSTFLAGLKNKWEMRYDNKLNDLYFYIFLLFVLNNIIFYYVFIYK